MSFVAAKIAGEEVGSSSAELVMNLAKRVERVEGERDRYRDARVDTITEARMAELRAQADEFLNQPVDHFPAEERCRRHGR